MTRNIAWLALSSVLLIGCTAGSLPAGPPSPSTAPSGAAVASSPFSETRSATATELIVPSDLIESQVASSSSQEPVQDQNRSPEMSTLSEIGSVVPEAAGSSREPRLIPSTSDFDDPVVVTEQWFGAWCWKPARGLANQNIATAAQWTTPVGHQSDLASAVTDDAWASVVAAGMSSGCEGVKAYRADAAPTAEGAVWVMVEATQVWTDMQGEVVREQLVSQTRQVVKDDTGRWLVDLEVSAG